MSSSIKQGVVLKHIIQERDSHKLPVYSELLPHTLQQVLKQYKIPSNHIKEEMHLPQPLSLYCGSILDPPYSRNLFTRGTNPLFKLYGKEGNSISPCRKMLNRSP